MKSQGSPPLKEDNMEEEAEEPKKGKEVEKEEEKEEEGKEENRTPSLSPQPAGWQLCERQLCEGGGVTEREGGVKGGHGPPEGGGVKSDKSQNCTPEREVRGGQDPPERGVKNDNAPPERGGVRGDCGPPERGGVRGSQGPPERGGVRNDCGPPERETVTPLQRRRRPNIRHSSRQRTRILPQLEEEVVKVEEGEVVEVVKVEEGEVEGERGNIGVKVRWYDLSGV